MFFFLSSAEFFFSKLSIKKNLSELPSECQTIMFFSKLVFRKILSELPSECRTVLIQILPDVSSGRIWV